MEPPLWPRKGLVSSMELLVSYMEFHGTVNIDIDKFHNAGSVFHCLLHDFIWIYIRQSISSWNNGISQL